MRKELQIRVDTDNRRFKKLFKIFFAWQEKKEEKWLREMSKEGWHLDNTSFLNYIFKKRGTKKIIYKNGLFIFSNKKM